MLHPMRTLLYVPGNKPGMIQKAPGYGADVLVLDLEDSVPPGEKGAARSTVAGVLSAGDLKGSKVMVRINGMGTSQAALDLEAVVVPGVMALRIPKVESATEMRDLDERVTVLERESGLEAGSLGFVPVLESPLGVLRAYEIAVSTPRIIAVTVGAEDLTAALRTERSREGSELEYARGHVAMCAAAAGVAAIDTVYSNVNDEEGLLAETRHVKQLGFAGKSVIHPRQIAPVHQVFTPTPQEVDRALRIVEAFRRARAEGSGAIAVDGRMVDLPVVARAKHILALAGASAAGADDE